LQGEAGEAKKAEKTLAVPYYKLFKYADKLDVLLVIGGTIAAIVEGAALPVFFVSAAPLSFVHLLHAICELLFGHTFFFVLLALSCCFIHKVKIEASCSRPLVSPPLPILHQGLKRFSRSKLPHGLSQAFFLLRSPNGIDEDVSLDVKARGHPWKNPCLTSEDAFEDLACF
jgi:hypothetical protein